MAMQVLHPSSNPLATTTDPTPSRPLFAARVVLDRAHARLVSLVDEHELRRTIATFVRDLDGLHAALTVDEWQAFVEMCRSHPLHQLLVTEEPYTRRAFMKPRGYAGDATMLDYVYRGIANLPLTLRGKALFRELAWESAAAKAVRVRKNLLSHLIDQTAAKKARPRILSLACGHLREAETSEALRRCQVDLVAADQDAQSLHEIERRYGWCGVQTANVSVRALLKGEVSFENFDFVYAAGLYDYLGKEAANRLTQILFNATAPGGKLLVANFVPDHEGHAYMNAFMEWNLVYRAPKDMYGLAAGIDPRSVDHARVFQRESCIAYLELTRTSPLAATVLA